MVEGLEALHSVIAGRLTQRSGWPGVSGTRVAFFSNFDYN
jgi:hypothetical protein